MRLAAAPYQAALLAGMIANPTAFNPVYHPARRDQRVATWCCRTCWPSATSPARQYRYGIHRKVPHDPSLIEQPQEPAAAPYFTSWVTPQILKAVGPFRAYYGGLKIRTTIDLKLQQAAEQAVTEELPTGPGEPTASLVSIDNATGQVRAMVGGPLVDGHQDYEHYPFNLATLGERQPGSSFKPFTLAVALQHGYTPDSVFDSKPLNLVVPNSGGKEIYHVHNDDNVYRGPITVAEATAESDNSVFTQLGLSPGVGTKRIRRMAKRMGITTPVSTNPAMIIGGLKVGVSPLEMAHAYETLATGGNRVYDPVLGSPHQGPDRDRGDPVPARQVPRQEQAGGDAASEADAAGLEVASTIHELLRGVVTSGTGQSAQISGVDVVGKTGTTTDEGDAWFVGWTPQFTTAVWVGFPNKLVPMLTQFNGGPVTGGTFPAEIWRAYMELALQINAEEHPPKPGTSTSTDDHRGRHQLHLHLRAEHRDRAGGDDPDPDGGADDPGADGAADDPRPAPTTPAPTTPAPTPTTPAPTTPTPTPTNPTGTTPSGGAGAG